MLTSVEELISGTRYEKASLKRVQKIFKNWINNLAWSNFIGKLYEIPFFSKIHELVFNGIFSFFFFLASYVKVQLLKMSKDKSKLPKKNNNKEDNKTETMPD